jgi:signal transduction histidine kinase
VETAATKSSETNYHLEIYDGARFEPFPNPPPKTVGEALLLLFVTQNGDLWLSGELGTEWYHDKKWQTFVAADRTMPEAPLGFTELADGRLWCATQDRIWEFNVDSRNWVSIRTGFDRINALLRTRDGSIWVASNSGMHRYVLGSWIENGIEEGLPGASAREIYEDHRGVWVGTTHGLSLYHPEADPPSDPPLTRIQELRDLEKNIPEGGTVPLTFSGQDRWKFTAPERLLYSYRLDDGEWSQFRDENSVVFPDLHAGNHVFQVRAMDRNCNIEPKPPRLEFAIVLPWYKETRLVLISCAGVAVALFFAGLAFNRHRQLLRSYAEVERKIDERTRELEVANRQLLHSQKMTALGTLAAGIAHDFNNILSIVQGSAQIIEDNLENPQKVRTRVDRIKTVVGQGAGIVKAMLGFSRDSDESPGQCDLNAVVEETIKLLGDRFLHEVQVRFDRGASLPPVLASKDFIQQILLNFIFNAAEAMPKQPHVVLTTRVMENLPLELVLKPALAAAYTCVSVEDFGCGISPENMARIFEPFFTTKAFSARRGTGLGLSMVYELARKMQAGLAAESVVDRGSKFTLILPVCQPQAGPESPI